MQRDSEGESAAAAIDDTVTVPDGTVADKRAKGAEGKGLPSGTAVGRYVIIDRIGAGGMGVVYRAYDPELDRRVALKLLPTDKNQNNDASTRLIREAQALAQLSHPNVVSAFDVGTVGANIFIAMEFVEGETISKWLKTPRTRREILNVFDSAGQGLAAAHNTGLVHRDFKPSNVMIGKDGRVRVLDFGLARAVDEDEDGDGDGGGDDSQDEKKTTPDRDGDPARSSAELEHSAGATELDDSREAMDETSGGADESQQSSNSSSLLGDQLTAVGQIVGTPAFMAPERMLGQPIDGRSDQFSFAVTLYRALYGQAPFSGNALKRRNKVLQGRVDAAPENTSVPVPTWLRRVLLRALDPDPQERYESMEALLRGLRNDPRQILQQRIKVTASVSAAILLVVLSGYILAKQRIDCTVPAEQLADIWSQPIRNKIRGNFANAASDAVSGTFERLNTHFQSYVDNWKDSYESSCRDTHHLKRYSAQVLDQRMTCLERRRTALASLSRALRGPLEKRALRKSVRAVLALPPVRDCNNVATLGTGPAQPADAEEKRRVTKLRSELQDVATMRNLGRVDEALTQTKELLERAEASHHAPIIAEVLFQTADLYGEAGNYAAEETHFRRAAAAAATARDRKLYAECWTELLFTVGYWLDRSDDVPPIQANGEAALAFLGEAPAVQARFLGKLGVIRWQQGATDQARKHLERALSLAETSIGSQHPDVAAMLNNMGLVLMALRKPAEAGKPFEQAAAIFESLFGPRNPSLAAVITNRADALRALGEHDKALQLMARVMLIEEETLGVAHPSFAKTLSGLGNLRSATREYRKALPNYTRALSILRKTLAPENPIIAATQGKLAAAMGHLPEHQAEALTLHRAALDRLTEALGQTHPVTLECQSLLGVSLRIQNRHAEATKIHQRVLALRQQALPAEHPDIGDALLRLGQDAVGAGQHDKAQRYFEQTLERTMSAEINGYQRAKRMLDLARGLWSVGQNGQAHQIAQNSLQNMLDDNASKLPIFSETSTWLELHEVAERRE